MTPLAHHRGDCVCLPSKNKHARYRISLHVLCQIDRGVCRVQRERRQAPINKKKRCIYPHERMRGAGRRGRGRGATGQKETAGHCRQRRERSTEISQRELRVRSIVRICMRVSPIAHPCEEIDEARNNSAPHCKGKIVITQQRYRAAVQHG